MDALVCDDPSNCSCVSSRISHTTRMTMLRKFFKSLMRAMNSWASPPYLGRQFKIHRRQTGDNNAFCFLTSSCAIIGLSYDNWWSVKVIPFIILVFVRWFLTRFRVKNSSTVEFSQKSLKTYVVFSWPYRYILPSAWSSQDTFHQGSHQIST
jgi:hypothetical protein